MMLTRIPKFLKEGYIIPDKDGCWGTKDAKLKPNAPQWAKDEYEAWLKSVEELQRLEFED